MQRIGILGLAVLGIVAWQILAAPPTLEPRLPAALDRPPATRNLPWLSTANGFLVDDHGRRVLLRGFNTTALLEWPTQPIAPFDEADAELIRRAGFNVVRLPIAWSRLEPRRGELSQAYLEQIETTVALLNRHGLYAVLDMHMSLSWSPRFGGAGAPPWAEVPLVPHVAVGLAGDWTDAASPAVQAANAYFWMSPDWQANLHDVWRAVAARFRGVSGVAGYDLYNEPNSLPMPPHVFEGRWMWPFYASLIEAVGEVDPNHIFIVEAPLILLPMAIVPPRMLPVDTPNLVYSPHQYTGAINQPLYPDDPQAVVRQIRAQLLEAEQLPAPAWWGELGVDTGKPFAAGWTDTVLHALDDVEAGWAWWQWRQDWGWGVRNHAGDFFNDDFLRHLARPFVTAAPRGVRAGPGDGVHGRLTLLVSADHDDVPIEVAWSATTLPPPHVDGSCVQSAAWSPARARLTVTVTPDAGCLITVRGATPDGGTGGLASRAGRRPGS